jgi:uncharacterized protein (DUF1697 family)
LVTVIAMLRGINVGGHKRVKMDALASLIKELGFNNVRTYLQSGNVVFDYSGEETLNLSEMIESAINRQYGFDAAVITRSTDELKNIVKNNPFMRERETDVSKLHITFLSDVPTESGLTKMKAVQGGPDRFFVTNREIYLFCPLGYGRTRFSNNYFETALGVTATTRNWETVNRLLGIAGSP